MLTALLLRAGGILVRSESEWDAIASSNGPPAVTCIYAAMMLAVPPTILVAMGMAGITLKYAPSDTIVSVGLAGLAATSVLVLALGGVIRWVVSSFDGATTYGRALVFTVYATTPMWLGGAIGNLFVPVQRAAAVIGFVWAIVLIMKGAVPMFGMPKSKRSVFAYTTALSLVVLWLIVLAFTTGFLMALTRT